METKETQCHPKPLVNATCNLGAKGCYGNGKCHYIGNCEHKITTNADRIRAMSDEEMAAFFAERDLILLRKALSVFEAESLIPENALTELRKDMLEALQKPAEEG